MNGAAVRGYSWRLPHELEDARPDGDGWIRTCSCGHWVAANELDDVNAAMEDHTKVGNDPTIRALNAEKDGV